MDIEQIIVTYNRVWSRNEALAFAAVFVAVAAILGRLVKAGRIRRCQMVCSLALLTYVAVVYASCVFTREPTGSHKAELVPLWSWFEVLVHHDRGLLKENLLNLVMLFPAGVLIPPSLGRRLGVLQLVVCGVVLSGGIEVLQYVLERGLFEWDDIIHNTLGLVVGGLVSGWLLEGWNRVRTWWVHRDSHA